MRSRATFALGVAALFSVASCAQSTPEQTASGGSSSATASEATLSSSSSPLTESEQTESSTSSSVIDATESEETTAPPVAAESVGAETECLPAQDGIDAADTFDEAGLNARNSRFVPLDDPEMVTASQATWLRPDDIVMGVVHGSGEAHAYPVSQMIYHHVANTSIAGEPYVVTY